VLRICNRPSHPSDATCSLDRCKPCLLVWPDAACGCLDLNGREHGEPGADHLRGDRDGAPADQVCTAARETEGDEPAAAWIGQAADLVAKDARIGTRAERQADLLLECGLGVGH